MSKNFDFRLIAKLRNRHMLLEKTNRYISSRERRYSVRRFGTGDQRDTPTLRYYATLYREGLKERGYARAFSGELDVKDLVCITRRTLL